MKLPRLRLLGTLLALAGCQTASDEPRESVADFPAERFFRRGNYPAQFFSGFMKAAGNGYVTIGHLETRLAFFSP